MVLLIDNYDSFAFNLARYFQLLGQSVDVVRNDALTDRDIDAIAASGYEAIVFSPGPCTPREAGRTLDMIGRWHRRLPILGVCLGHQAIVEKLGGRIIRAQRPMHGRSSGIFHDQSGEFSGIPSPFVAGRYHSLVAAPGEVPACLRVTAWTEDEVIMAVRHSVLPLVGWQFHPESILTPVGLDLLRGFLRLAGLPAKPDCHPDSEREIRRGGNRDVWPDRPVTF